MVHITSNSAIALIAIFAASASAVNVPSGGPNIPTPSPSVQDLEKAARLGAEGANVKLDNLPRHNLPMQEEAAAATTETVYVTVTSTDCACTAGAEFPTTEAVIAPVPTTTAMVTGMTQQNSTSTATLGNNTDSEQEEELSSWLSKATTLPAASEVPAATTEVVVPIAPTGTGIVGTGSPSGVPVPSGVPSGVPYPGSHNGTVTPPGTGANTTKGLTGPDVQVPTEAQSAASTLVFSSLLAGSVAVMLALM
ncbi:hypothetical protein DFH27DRAFT_611792 [Peziza echinospora]|nr:hypothetical protein DFH27DRAFT_611792 [Peziza echinospora]